MQQYEHQINCQCNFKFFKLLFQSYIIYIYIYQTWAPGSKSGSGIRSHGSGSEIQPDHRSGPYILSWDPVGSWIHPKILSWDPLGSQIHPKILPWDPLGSNNTVILYSFLYPNQALKCHRTYALGIQYVPQVQHTSMHY